jgi:hypothetical protein
LTLEVLSTRRFQPGIEFIQRPHLRHCYEEVGTAVADNAFNHALLIAPGWTAEVFLKEIVAL